MVVRCKFRVTEVAKIMGSAPIGPNGEWVECPLERVKLSPAYGPGNEAWSAATPSGSVELSISNPGAVGKLELGKSYFVDFIPEAAAT